MKLPSLALLSLLLLLLPSAAEAQRRRITAPVDIAVGPTALLFFGPVFDDQPIHTGLRINVEAVLDKEWLRKHQALIPRKQRGRVSKMGEIRYAPAVLGLIPETLIISPKYKNTGMYGATWKPLGFGLGLTPSPVRLSLDAGLVLTYAYMYSDTLPNTHFLRPGLQLTADLEFQLSESFLVSLGWSSAAYIPQRVGTFTETKPLNGSIFHVGQAFLLLHFRVPFTVTM
ncbi:MAG TPA: hypothetical protein VK539_40255 [Myxococcaceae bacterium]|nr:hypothetical protein [Myxococcaceae bacterium]